MQLSWQRYAAAGSLVAMLFLIGVAALGRPPRAESQPQSDGERLRTLENLVAEQAKTLRALQSKARTTPITIAVPEGTRFDVPLSLDPGKARACAANVSRSPMFVGTPGQEFLRGTIDSFSATVSSFGSISFASGSVSVTGTITPAGRIAYEPTTAAIEFRDEITGSLGNPITLFNQQCIEVTIPPGTTAVRTSATNGAWIVSLSDIPFAVAAP